MSVGKLASGHALFALGFTVGKDPRTPPAMHLRRNHALMRGDQVGGGSAFGGCAASEIKRKGGETCRVRMRRYASGDGQVGKRQHSRSVRSTAANSSPEALGDGELRAGGRWRRENSTFTHANARSAES
ncbi:hypothetical protein AXG93_2175s1910 [Marchantia polymorpha subsp. ruderalis]|uniref:Uncharacterized protein n=1 Tax=Marchantia polymorpha subsp. ruderalis TaxID=1480154 RepID=A0A176W6C7_MARPO|nr:hypothetical protein AXG93_2175s1910 [Marchantia polymorpha subsp. ruderalis]